MPCPCWPAVTISTGRGWLIRTCSHPDRRTSANFVKQGLPITYLRFMLGGRSELPEVPDFEEDDNLDASQLGE